MIKVGDTVIVHSGSLRHRIPHGTKVQVITTLIIGLQVTYKDDRGTIRTRYVYRDDVEKEFRDETRLGKLL